MFLASALFSVVALAPVSSAAGLEQRNLPGKKSASSSASGKKKDGAPVSLKVPGGCDPTQSLYYTTIAAMQFDYESLLMKEFRLDLGLDFSAPPTELADEYIAFTKEYYREDLFWQLNLFDYNNNTQTPTTSVTYTDRQTFAEGQGAIPPAYRAFAAANNGFENLNGVGSFAVCNDDGSARLVVRTSDFFVRLTDDDGSGFFDNTLLPTRIELLFDEDGKLYHEIGDLDLFGRVEYTG